MEWGGGRHACKHYGEYGAENGNCILPGNYRRKETPLKKLA
jgi:hypothetical protein